jgi:hypothetical protein
MLITLGMLSLFHKFGGRISFARWLIVGKLRHYLPPSEDELKEQVGLTPAKSQKRKKWDKYFQPAANFNIPKKLDFPVYSCTLRESDIQILPYYAEYTWLLDFAFGALFVYIVSEIYYYYFSTSQEINLSLIWCCLVLAFAT